MIAHLRGKLIYKQPGQAIVEAAGVGYDVTISVPTFTALPSVGAEAALHIHTQVSGRPDRALRFSRSRGEAALRAADYGERRGAEAGHQNAERAFAGADGAGHSRRRTTRNSRAFPAWARSWPSGSWSSSKTSSTILPWRPCRRPCRARPWTTCSPRSINLGYQRAAAEKAIEQAIAKDKALAADFDGLFRGALKVIR